MGRLSCLALFVVAIAARANAQSRLTKPTIDTINHHIVRVMNSGPTAWTDTNGWKLTLERTVQPPEGSAGELAKPTTALVTSGGQIVVADWQTPRVGLYDRSGRFVRLLGRPGAGPGEFATGVTLDIARANTGVRRSRCTSTRW